MARPLLLIRKCQICKKDLGKSYHWYCSECESQIKEHFKEIEGIHQDLAMDIILKRCEPLGCYVGVSIDEEYKKYLVVCPIITDENGVCSPEMDGPVYNLGEFYECPDIHKKLLQDMFPEALEAVELIKFYPGVLSNPDNYPRAEDKFDWNKE